MDHSCVWVCVCECTHVSLCAPLRVCEPVRVQGGAGVDWEGVVYFQGPGPLSVRVSFPAL